MGIAGKVAKAKAAAGGKYLKEGNYLCWIERCKEIENGVGEDVFVTELHILESTNDSRPAGDTADWVQNFRFMNAPGNVKAFLQAGLGSEEEAEDKDVLNAILGEDNQLRGAVVAVECFKTITKTNKKEIEVCRFNAVDSATQARGEELHAELFG